MTINHSKTVVMHIIYLLSISAPQLSVGPHHFQVVQTAKIFGVMVDDQLT